VLESPFKRMYCQVTLVIMNWTSLLDTESSLGQASRPHDVRFHYLFSENERYIVSGKSGISASEESYCSVCVPCSSSRNPMLYLLSLR
jgi:hypothetical protein